MATSERYLTLPNALSGFRIVLIPVFLWLVLGPHYDELALAVLVVSAITDWLDGRIARKLNQTSAFGALLDPIADRLYILAVVVALALRDIIPVWLAVVLPLRDILLLALLPTLRRHGYSAVPVHFLGKAATACLLYAFPLLLLGDGYDAVAQLAKVFGWSFAIWGTGLYWWSGIIYALQIRRLVAAPRLDRA